MIDEPPVRDVTDRQRIEIKEKLYYLRKKLLGGTSISLLNVGLLTGLSNTVISNIVAIVQCTFFLSRKSFLNMCFKGHVLKK